MGTLYDQKPRTIRNITRLDEDYFFEEIIELSKKYKMTHQDVINGLKVLELKRRNDLFVDNADIYDEQIAGIGQEFQKISSALDSIASAIEDKE